MKKNNLPQGMGWISRLKKSLVVAAALLIMSTFAANSYGAMYITELKIEDDNNYYWDRLMLLFDSTRYDFKDSYDAIKWTNPEVNFYTFSSENIKLAIDARPYAENKRIKTGLTTPYQKTYYIRVVQHAMPTGTCLCLRDNYKDTTVTLSTGMKYYFTVNSDPASQGDNRFEFVCSRPYVQATMPAAPFSAALSSPQANPYSNSSQYVIYKGYGQQSFNFTATVSGGKPGYTYSWFPTTGVDSPNAASANLAPQVTTTYTLTVKDGNDSIKTYTRTIYVADATCGTGYVSVCNSGITQCISPADVPAQLSVTGNYLGACLVANPIVTNIACYGNQNGAINITPAGAVAPYTYSWSNNAATEDISNLAAGTYAVTISAIDGRSVTTQVNITQPSQLALTTTMQSNVSCNGGSNGIVSVNATGGTSPYTYLWNDNSTSNSRTGLQAGTYTVTATDNKGCTISGNYTLSQPAAITGTASVSPLYLVQGQDSATIYRGYGPQSATLSASVSGGTGAYTYKWSPASRVSDQYSLTTVATPTLTTNFTLTVTDANGCKENFSYRIYVVNAKCGNNNNSKVRLCYNGNDYCVNQSQVQGYLNNGALLGYCGSGNKGGAEETATLLSEAVTEATVYPNPSGGIFNIQVPGEVKGGNMMVTDFSGRLVKQLEFTAGSKIGIDMSQEPRGIYMLQLNNGNDIYRLRLVLAD